MKIDLNEVSPLSPEISYKRDKGTKQKGLSPLEFKGTFSAVGGQGRDIQVLSMSPVPCVPSWLLLGLFFSLFNNLMDNRY